MTAIDFHESAHEDALERSLAQSLRENRLDPKLLYVTLWLVDLWRNVHKRHSPVHDNPEFARIYGEAFARTANLASERTWLVGLGCGTGTKEAQLAETLKAHGSEVLFSAVDVSPDLVTESVECVVAAGAAPERSLVCDLAEVATLADWLNRTHLTVPRVFTFFGIVPNMAPSLVTNLFRALLRPHDVLLVSAHMAPVTDSVDLTAAMEQVLPQYQNPETMAWLEAALQHWKLTSQTEEPTLRVGEVENVPAFIGEAKWKSGDKAPLQIFRSLRYTPALFEKLLQQAGFHFEQLAMTACREEAIWVVHL